MSFCLMPEAVSRFKAGLKDGSINPAKLSDMSSADRNKFFEKYVGTSATDVNALFESKLLLKNQKQGMITWAKSVAGLTESAKQDILSKISRLDNVLDTHDKRAFLHDLASSKLGMNITQNEAQNIADLSKAVEAARNGSDRMEYGRAAVKMTNYINKLKVGSEKIKLKDFKTNPLGTAGKLLSRGAGNAKAINASMDNSAIFRQGWKTLITHPGIWRKNAQQSFVNIVKQFGGHEVMDEVHASIVSDPNYERMIKAKLAVTNLEEAYPTSAPEKIPLIGRAYKASEVAYTAFVQKTRVDVFNKYLEIAQKSGINIDDPEQLKSIGKLVNSLTGRGSLGKLEPVGNVVNNVFFSPRFLKSNVDILTLHAGDNMTTFARKQAAKNLLKIISATAAIMTIANTVRPGSAQLDPRSSDFGKIKVGHTRFDITGGAGSVVVLASRLATLSSKSSTTGQVTSLTSGKYGALTGVDVFNNFVDNKLSPVASVARDMLRGQDGSGNKATPLNEAKNLLTPIGLQNFQQTANDPQSANILMTTILDGLGISANTYNGSKSGQSPWETSTSKELTQFKDKVGVDKFKNASNQYNQKTNSFMDSIVKNKSYTSLSADDQKKVITEEKNKIKKDIFKANGFKYKAPKSNSKQLKKFLQ